MRYEVFDWRDGRVIARVPLLMLARLLAGAYRAHYVRRYGRSV